MEKRKGEGIQKLQSDFKIDCVLDEKKKKKKILKKIKF